MDKFYEVIENQVQEDEEGSAEQVSIVANHMLRILAARKKFDRAATENVVMTVCIPINHVNIRTLSGYVNGQPEVTEPKTKRSKKRIDLDDLTIQMLTERYTKKEEYVFSNKDGTMYSRQAIKLPKICENAGIKPRSFHTLRHTHATVLLAAGIHPKIIQERLGHSNISTTLDIYSHLVAGMQQAAVDVFNEIK